MGATSFKGMGKVTLGIAVDSVERVALDFAVTLITDNGAAIRIETTFTLRLADGTTVVVDPTNPAKSIAVVPSVLHEMITEGAATDDTAALGLEFVHSSRIGRRPAHGTR
jgi:hypothetical protein